MGIQSLLLQSTENFRTKHLIHKLAALIHNPNSNWHALPGFQDSLNKNLFLVILSPPVVNTGLPQKGHFICWTNCSPQGFRDVGVACRPTTQAITVIKD